MKGCITNIEDDTLKNRDFRLGNRLHSEDARRPSIGASGAAREGDDPSPVKKQSDAIFLDENFSHSTGCGVLVGVWHTRSDRFRLP